jgi:hypothetical protein
MSKQRNPGTTGIVQFDVETEDGAVVHGVERWENMSLVGSERPWEIMCPVLSMAGSSRIGAGSSHSSSKGPEAGAAWCV